LLLVATCDLAAPLQRRGGVWPVIGLGQRNILYFRSASRKEREALLVAGARKASRYFRSAAHLHSTSGTRPRSQTATTYTMQSPFTPPRSVTSLARAVSRRPPQRHPPCVLRSPALFSACSQHTGSTAYVWCVCRPLALFSAIAHSISSIGGPLPVPSCSCKRPISVVFNVLGVALAA
jgi:hypothetical protein